MASPAATIGCYHVCPASDGNHSHVGGAIISSSTTVFFECKAACRQGDSLQCDSPNLDTVQQGSSAVFINGKPAARKGDATAHGGQIIEGVSTIFIG